MSHPIRGQGGHLVFTIGPKNLNLVEDVEFLLPVKCRWIRLAISEEKSKMSQPIKSPGRTFSFYDRPKNTNLVEDVHILLPVKFRWIPFNGFRGEVENVSANQRPGWQSCFLQSTPKHKLCRGRWDLASCKVSSNSVLAVSKEKSKMSQQIRRRGGHLVFPLGPKYTKLVEDIEIFLRVKFRWIPFSDFRGEVEHVLANQRPGGHVVFPMSPKTQTWMRKLRWCFLSSFVEFRSEVVEEKLKKWKVNDDGRSTDDGPRTTLEHNI